MNIKNKKAETQMRFCFFICLLIQVISLGMDYF